MPVTLSGSDRTIHTTMQAVSPSSDIDAGVFRLGDNLPNGDDIALGSMAVGPGFTGTLTLTLVRHADSTGDSSVKLFHRYLDAAGNVLSAVSSSAFTVNATPADQTMTLSAAPAGTAMLVYGLSSNMTPPGDPTRFNAYTDPRCLDASRWSGRNSWVMGTGADATGLPAGVVSYVKATPASAGAAAHSGLNMYDTPAASSPTANKGLPVTPGATYTISAYMYSTKAGSVQASYRFFAGTTWTAAATDSAAVALSASTWTRVSFTFTVPAGAMYMVAAWRIPASITWATTDQIRITAMLLEDGSTLAPFFDGDGIDASVPSPKSSRWEGAANASRSLLYAATVPGAPSVQAAASLLTYSADAQELIGAALERNLRRSVADIWGAEQALITAGTSGLLQGQLTFLCASLAQALALDSIYRLAGLVTLGSSDELNGLTHRAVGSSRMSPENALPGRASKWTLVVDFREQREG